MLVRRLSRPVAIAAGVGLSIGFISIGTQSSAVGSGSSVGWFTATGTSGSTTPSVGRAAVSLSDGTILIGGEYTQNISFPPSQTLYSPTPGSFTAPFVAQASASGLGFDWVTALKASPSGIGAGSILAMTVVDDSTPTLTDDTVIVVGSFTGTIYFPRSATADDSIALTAFASSQASNRDIFVASMAPGSRYFTWAQRAGGTNSGGSNDRALGVVVTGDDTVFVFGEHQGTTYFPRSATADDSIAVATTSNNSQSFLAAMGKDSPYFAWVQSIRSTSSSNQSSGYGIASSDDTVYVTGAFNGTLEFPGNGSPISLTAYDSSLVDMYVAALGSDDTYFNWAQRAGSNSSYDAGRAVAVSPDGSLFVTGQFQGNATFPTLSGSITLSSFGTRDIFVATMNGDDSYFQWAQRAGSTFGTDRDASYAIAFQDDTPIIAGSFEGTARFPTGRAAPDDSITLTALGSQDVFVAALNRDDSYFRWAQRAGGMGNAGSDEDAAYALAVTRDDTPAATGVFYNTGYFPTGVADDSWVVTGGNANPRVNIFFGHLGLGGVVFSTPGAPTGLTATPGNASATISFTPGATGGSPITNYQYSTDGNTWTAFSPAVTNAPVTVTGLTNGVTYGIQLRAVNAAGYSNPAGVSVTPNGSAPGPNADPVYPPGAPTDVKATAGSGEATITWAAPTYVGSYPITDYQVTSSTGSHTCLSKTTSCTVTGLTGGTTYTFTVRALNGAGWGAHSAPSNAVTPIAKSIVITGSRDASDDRFVTVKGTTTDLAGKQVIPWVRFPGQTDYAAGTGVRTVSADGTFTWQRKTGKKTYVYFELLAVRSNTVVIPAR